MQVQHVWLTKGVDLNVIQKHDALQQQGSKAVGQL